MQNFAAKIKIDQRLSIFYASCQFLVGLQLFWLKIDFSYQIIGLSFCFLHAFCTWFCHFWAKSQKKCFLFAAQK